MSQFLRDVRVGIETAGAVGFASRILEEVTGRAYRRSRLMIIEQDVGAVTHVRRPRGVTVEPFAGDWARVDPILTSRARDRFSLRIEAGRHCLLAYKNGRVVGYTWISPEIDMEIEELPLALPADAAYLWDLFVFHGQRSGGIGSALTSARLAYAREAGFRLGWRAISPKNRASIRTAEKTGAVRILGEIRIERTLGMERFREERFEDRPLLTGSAPDGGCGR